MKLLLLLQRSDPVRAPHIPDFPSFVVPFHHPSRVPLSVARNMLLRPALARGEIAADALVGFPDDDCWYPPGFLARLLALFERHATLDFWFCRYGSQPIAASFASVPARTGQIVRNASSNTIFLRGRAVRAVGEFDEALGVGSALGGAEDTDYALRASRFSRGTLFSDTVLVGHRDKSADVRVRYYASGLVVLARHDGPGARLQFLRKLAVGVYFILRKQLTPQAFVAALQQALAARRAASRAGDART